MLESGTSGNDVLSERDTFSAVYAEHQNQVRRILFRMIPDADVDDLVQETFIRVFQNMKNFRGDCQMSSWIYRIAMNTGRDYLRHKKRRSWLSFSSDESYREQASENDHHGSREKIGDIEQAVNSLPVKLREVTVLASLQELSIKEISSVLQVPEGTVKSRLHKAREILRKKIKEVE